MGKGEIIAVSTYMHLASDIGKNTSATCMLVDTRVWTSEAPSWKLNAKIARSVSKLKGILSGLCPQFIR